MASRARMTGWPARGRAALAAATLAVGVSVVCAPAADAASGCEISATGAVCTKPGTHAWKVPAKVKRVTISVLGAGGGGGGNGLITTYPATAGGGGGSGGLTRCLLAVTPGDTLTITVAGGGATGRSATDHGSGGAGGSGRPGRDRGGQGDPGRNLFDQPEYVGGGGGGGGASRVTGAGNLNVSAGGGGGGGGGTSFDNVNTLGGRGGWGGSIHGGKGGLGGRYKSWATTQPTTDGGLGGQGAETSECGPGQIGTDALLLAGGDGVAGNPTGVGTGGSRPTGTPASCGKAAGAGGKGGTTTTAAATGSGGCIVISTT